MRAIPILLLAATLAACQPAPPLASIGRQVRSPPGLCAADAVTIDKAGKTGCASRRN